MADTTPDLPSRLQAFLFSEGGSLTLRKLEHLLGVKRDELKTALKELAARLEGTGMTLIQTDSEATLAVAPVISDELRKAYELELGREIGDAGLEVIAIILYRGPSTRAQIDYIRGVNTSSTIRTLLSRGLIERVGNPDDGREYLYKPTTELLAHLGLRGMNELPDYAKIANELAAFEQKSGPFHDNGGTPDNAHNGSGDQP